jgi:hypothetical protein
MPAIRFFKMLESSRRLEDRQKYTMMTELCDISAISLCNAEYYDEVRGRFMAFATGNKVKRGPTAQMDAKDPRVPVILSSIFSQKGKLEGLNG